MEKTTKNVVAPKTQHYVPQFILRNFSSNNDELIWVYDIKRNVEFNPTINDIAQEKYFYNIEIDEDLKATIELSLQKIEYDVSIIINKIIESESISFLNNEEQVLIRYFLAIQLTRTKASRNRFKDLANRLKEHTLKMGLDPEICSKEFDMTENEFAIQHVMSIQQSHEYLPYLNDLICVLFKTEPDQYLLISDDPVIMTNKKESAIGLAFKGIEVYLPISNNLALGFLCPTLKDKCDKDYEKLVTLDNVNLLTSYLTNKANQMKLQYIEAFNHNKTIITPKRFSDSLKKMQIWNASRFIFSSNSDFSLVRKVFEEYPEAMNPLTYK